jgi:hypothetical protein
MTEVDGVAEPTKDELLTAVAGGRAGWTAMLAEAGAHIDEPGPAGHWTLRDVVAHVNAYQRFLVLNLGGTARDFDPMPESIGDDFQKRNEWMHDADRDLSWDFVTNESEELHAELLAQISKRSADELREPMVEWFPWPAWRWIVSLTRDHYDEHTPDLRAWLDGLPAG